MAKARGEEYERRMQERDAEAEYCPSLLRGVGLASSAVNRVAAQKMQRQLKIVMGRRL